MKQGPREHIFFNKEYAIYKCSLKLFQYVIPLSYTCNITYAYAMLTL